VLTARRACRRACRRHSDARRTRVHRPAPPSWESDLPLTECVCLPRVPAARAPTNSLWLPSPSRLASQARHGGPARPPRRGDHGPLNLKLLTEARRRARPGPGRRRSRASGGRQGARGGESEGPASERAVLETTVQNGGAERGPGRTRASAPFREAVCCPWTGWRPRRTRRHLPPRLCAAGTRHNAQASTFDLHTGVPLICTCICRVTGFRDPLIPLLGSCPPRLSHWQQACRAT